MSTQAVEPRLMNCKVWPFPEEANDLGETPTQAKPS